MEMIRNEVDMPNSFRSTKAPHIVNFEDVNLIFW